MRLKLRARQKKLTMKKCVCVDGVHNEVVGYYTIVMYFHFHTTIIVNNKKQQLVVFASYW